jgi:hypothetical protein
VNCDSKQAISFQEDTCPKSRIRGKLLDWLHFEQYRPGFFGPWGGLVLDWFSFPQLDLD